MENHVVAEQLRSIRTDLDRLLAALNYQPPRNIEPLLEELAAQQPNPFPARPFYRHVKHHLPLSERRIAAVLLALGYRRYRRADANYWIKPRGLWTGVLSPSDDLPSP